MNASLTLVATKLAFVINQKLALRQFKLDF